MPRPTLEIGNSKSRFAGLPHEIFALLRFELSFQTGEAGSQVRPDFTGTMRVNEWDGFTRLLGKNGVMPSGLVPRALRLLKKWRVSVQVQDLRQRPAEQMPRWTLPDGFVLRDYQSSAVNRAWKVGRGVIDSPPRSGKTILMAELTRLVSAPTVVTAPTESIASQTYDKFLELFKRNEWSRQIKDCSSDFYLLTGGPPRTRIERRAAGKALVFVATDATAAAMSADWWSEIQCWIADERHHQAAKTHRVINDLAINAFYRFGFTGTNYRTNATEQVALEAPLGRTIASYTIAEMIERGVLVQGRVEFWPVFHPGLRRKKFATAYSEGIVDDDLRNKAICYAALKLREVGRKTLILVHQIKHGEKLQRMIPGSRFVQGSDGEEVRKAVKDLDDGTIRVLIGSPVVGEGLDCPSADALIYAKGRKARVTHTQDTFRVLTACGQKKDALIIDFADRHNCSLEDHSVARSLNYLAMGLPCDVLSQMPAIDDAQIKLY